MTEPTDRPTVRRRRLLAGGASALALAVAGCNALDDDERADPEATVAYVPAEAGVVVDADMTLLEHEPSRELLDAYDAAAEEAAAETDDDAAADGDEEGEAGSFVETVERRTGVDPRDADAVLAFADEPDPERMTLVVDGEFDETDAEEALASAQADEYEAEDHDTGTIYRPVDGDEDDLHLGVAAQGQFVVGPEASVRRALDAFGDEGERLDGPLLEALEDGWSPSGIEAVDAEDVGDGADADDADSDDADGDDEADTDDDADADDGEADDADAEDGEADDTDTDDSGGDDADAEESPGTPDADGDELTPYVVAATDEPREYVPEDEIEIPPQVSLDAVEELETARATYLAAGESVGIDVELRAPDEETASELSDLIGVALVYLRGEMDDDVAAELERVSVETDGSIVRVVYLGDVGGASALLDEF